MQSSIWWKVRFPWFLITAGTVLLVVGIFWQYRVSSLHTSLFKRTWLLLSRGSTLKEQIQSMETHMKAATRLNNAQRTADLKEWSESKSNLLRAYKAFERSLNRVLEQPDTPQETLWMILEFKQRWSDYQSRLSNWETKSALKENTLRDEKFAKQTLLDLVTVKNLYESRFSAQLDQLQQTQIAAFVICLVGMGLLSIGLWARWLRPTWLLRDLNWGIDADALPPIPHSLKGTEWEQFWCAIQKLGHRLKLSEQFMRDLSMGRQPAPLQPESENDRLARSSYWLARYWEQLQAEVARSRRAG